MYKYWFSDWIIILMNEFTLFQIYPNYYLYIKLFLNRLFKALYNSKMNLYMVLSLSYEFTFQESKSNLQTVETWVNRLLQYFT